MDFFAHFYVFFIAQATQQDYEKEVKRFEAEQKLKTLDAIDWFPKAMKVCTAFDSMDGLSFTVGASLFFVCSENI